MKGEFSHDKQLLHRLANSDLEAFRIIYDYYFPVLDKFVRRWVKDEAMAKDITQDIFLAVWEKRARYDSVENLRTYLYSIARNMSFDAIRKMMRQQEAQNEIELQKSTNGIPLSGTEIEGLLHQTVALLPDQQKKCFTLAHHEGLPYRQIADTLGITTNTVKTHLLQANKFIRERIISNHPLENIKVTEDL